MKISDLIKPIIIVGGLVILICYLIKKPVTLGDYSSYISYAVSSVTVLFVIYERWAWKVIPWKRPPIFKKHYDGTITYTEKKETKTKKIDVHIKQSLFSVKVETQTDINGSCSITASIEQEYDGYVLYYTYITNPNANVQKSNPIQHGTCRMTLKKDMSSINGKYWTTSQTTGDIQWVEHRV
jgi:hypothetical protein